MGNADLSTLDVQPTQESMRQMARETQNAGYRAMFEQSPIAIQTFAADGTALTANAAWTELWQTELEQLQGYNILQDEQLVQKGIMPYIRAAFAGKAQRIPPILYDPADIGKVGRPRWVRSNVFPVVSPQGQVTEVVLFLEDVTDQEENRIDAERARTRYEALVRASAQVVWSTNAQGLVVEDLPSWREFTGQTYDELIGHGWMACMHPEDLERSEAIWRQSLETGMPHVKEFRVRAANGEYRLVRANAVPIKDESGAVREWVGTCTDITEQRLAEEALEELTRDLERRVEERTAALRQANQDLEAFTYSIAHDLRAPLRSIIASARILMEDHAKELSPTATELLGRHVEAARKLAQLTDDLLALSRMTRQSLSPQQVDVTALCTELIAEQFPESSCTFEVQPGLTAYADPQLLMVALSNLIGNAVKYSPDGGRVRIGRNAAGELFVSDEGIGFDMEYVDKIWLPFERLVREDQFPGTGIGLASVRHIVERHRGTIRAESVVGKGSTFSFRLGLR